MKSLYESILQSTGSGRTEYVKHLIQNPQEDKVNSLNRTWKELGLSFDVGYGEGEWVWHPVNETYCYLVNVKIYETAYSSRRKIERETIATCNEDEKHILPGTHAILINKDCCDKKKVTDWAKKVAEVLKLKLTNKVYIFLDI